MSIIKRILAYTEIDAAVVFSLLTRGWQSLAGIITLLLIVQYFSSELQGYYYTFASLLALQAFAELGFFLVIINVASHEWAHLKLGKDNEITGNIDSLSRLISLGQLVFKWYAFASVIFVIVVGVVGYIFLSQKTTNIDWQGPWLAMVFLAGLLMSTLPFISLLEGCNQVKAVNKFRLTQGVLASMALWLTMVSGGELWATVSASGIAALYTIYFLMWKYRKFFRSFFKNINGKKMLWKKEIWPMQWRLAIQGMIGYFMFSFFVPVIFQYHGAVEAGKIGLTWQIVATLQLLTLSLVQTKVPKLGIMIAKKDYDSLDRLWWKITISSMVFITIAGSLFVLSIYVLQALDIYISERLLGILPTGMFVVALIFAHFTQCCAAYLRAHKKEVLTLPGVVTGLVAGVLIWWLGRVYGTTGAVMAYMIVTLFISFPAVVYIWHRSRIAWHSV